MRKRLLTGLIFLAMIFGSSLTATAFNYDTIGDNITIYDGNSNDTDWHGSSEDQEVEPGATHGQAWDMEAFFWDNSNHKLTMVGGYNLINGKGDTSPGDIFIDVGRDGTYNYAINFASINTGSFYATLYTLTNNSNYTTATDFTFSNPVSLNVNGESNSSLSASYQTGLTDGSGLLGDESSSGSHNALTLDFTGILSDSDLDLDTNGTGFALHFTMSCGNDMLKGGAGPSSETPIPGAFWLLGSGLFGLIGIRRRRQS